MFCNITTNKEGKIVVKADNGKPSLLYKHLKGTLKNDKLALEKWAITKTPEFNAQHIDLQYVDENGEPSMLYVIPESDFLYYGKKDTASSAKAKDTISQEDRYKEAKAELITQSEIIKNTILKDVKTFKTAEGASAATNKYAYVANHMSRQLLNSPDAVTAITNFAGWSQWYLKQAREKLALLKSESNTNARLENLNELGQLLIIFDNLQQFRTLTGYYEKSFFAVQVEGFFEEHGITISNEVRNAIRYSSSQPKNLAIIRKFLTDKLKTLSLDSEQKNAILKAYENLIDNRDNLTSVLDDIVNERDILQRKLRNEYHEAITDWLYPFIEENQENISKGNQISRKMFKDYLKQAKEDAGSIEYFLSSLSTINDPIAQAIRLAAEQARYNGHARTVENMSRLSTAKKEQFGDKELTEKDYEKYLKTIDRQIRTIDEDGNEVYKTIATKALVMPWITENLERDRDIQRNKQAAIYTAIEDKKIAGLEEAIKKEGLTDRQVESIRVRLELAKVDKDFNVRKAVAKAMNAWYETKYDIVKYKDDLIKRKKLELSPDDFKNWYLNNIYQRTISADEFEQHKKTRGKYRMIHPEHLDDAEIKNSSYYKEGKTVKGKPTEYYVYEIFYGGEFTTPKDEYIDPRYNELSKDKFYQELVRVYQDANNVLSPQHKLKHGIIPQIEKGGKFWDFDKTLNENASKMVSKLKPDIYEDSNTHEIEIDGVFIKMSKDIQTVDGSTIKTIPINFISLLDDVENLDTNLIETFSKFSAVSNRHNELSKTNASARALKYLVSGNPEMGITAREVIMTDSKGNAVVTAIDKATNTVLSYAIKDKDPRINKLLVDFIDDIWYGDIEEKQSFNAFGKQVSVNKLANFTSKWVSIQRLAGNLDSAISNLVIGKLAIFQESLAGRYYTLSQYYEATKIINKELYDGTVINDYMQEDINQKSLYAQMMIRQDAIQGEFSNEYGIKISKKTASEMAGDFLFFSQNGMEYTIQKRSMLCVSKGFKVLLPDNMVYDKDANDGMGDIRSATPEEIQASKDARASIETKYKALLEEQQKAIEAQEQLKPTTKEQIRIVAKNISKMRRDLENISSRKEDELSKVATNYFTGLDAYTRDKDTGAIKVKDSLKAYFTPKVEGKLRRRIQELNKRQQGNYAAMDKSQAQRHWIGKLALMFRKYLYSAYDHRFGDRKVNFALGEESYGYQRQFINKFLQDYRAYGKWAFTKLMDGSASPQEQYAINKTLTEYATWAAFFVLFWLMKSLNDDDDEKTWAYSKTAYIVKRTEDSLSEFTLPFGIGNLVRTFKNPLSSLVLLEQVYEVIAVIFDDPMNLGGQYERDSGLNEKGDSKFLGKLFKVAPILRQYAKFMTPEEQLKYYTQRKTNI